MAVLLPQRMRQNRSDIFFGRQTATLKQTSAAFLKCCPLFCSIAEVHLSYSSEEEYPGKMQEGQQMCLRSSVAPCAAAKIDAADEDRLTGVQTGS